MQVSAGGAPQAVPIGAPVTAYVRAEDIKILYPERPLSEPVRHNQVQGRILRRRPGPGPGHQTLTVALPNGHQVQITFPRYAYHPLALEPGDDIRIVLRKEGIGLLPAAAPGDAAHDIRAGEEP